MFNQGLRSEFVFYARWGYRGYPVSVALKERVSAIILERNEASKDWIETS